MSNCALSQTFDGHSCLNTLFISLAILGIFAGLRARAYQHLKHLKLFFGRIGCSVSSKVDQKAATQVHSKIWVTYLMQSQRQATQTFCLLSLFKQNFKEGLIIFICSIIRDLRRDRNEILKLWKNNKKKNREWGTRAQEVCRNRRSQNLREKLDVSHLTNNLVFWEGRWSA